MITILLLIIVYLLSAFAVYKWVQISHYHKNGIFKGQRTGGHEIAFVILPLFNTIAAIYFWLLSWPYESSINFFKPKNYGTTRTKTS